MMKSNKNGELLELVFAYPLEFSKFQLFSFSKPHPW